MFHNLQLPFSDWKFPSWITGLAFTAGPTHVPARRERLLIGCLKRLGKFQGGYNHRAAIPGSTLATFVLYEQIICYSKQLRVRVARRVARRVVI